MITVQLSDCVVRDAAKHPLQFAELPRINVGKRYTPLADDVVIPRPCGDQKPDEEPRLHAILDIILRIPRSMRVSSGTNYERSMAAP